MNQDARIRQREAFAVRARRARFARRPSAPEPFAFRSPWKTCRPREYYTSPFARREVTFSLRPARRRFVVATVGAYSPVASAGFWPLASALAAASDVASV